MVDGTWEPAARTEAGVHKEVISLSSYPAGIPLSKLANVLAERHPNTNLRGVLETSSWSVDEEMIDKDDVPNVVLKGGEEVGVICPVSGG